MKHLPSWPLLRNSLIFGATCPLRPLDPVTLTKDFTAGLEKGNNKSARDESEWVGKQFENEVKRGWTLALPIRAGTKFAGGVYAPLGVVEQDTINEKGQIVPKKATSTQHVKERPDLEVFRQQPNSRGRTRERSVWIFPPTCDPLYSATPPCPTTTKNFALQSRL